MLIDEVIEKLTTIRKEHGNLDVRYLDCEYGDTFSARVEFVPARKVPTDGKNIYPEAFTAYVEIS
jgi:hypothetical protein